MILDLDLNFCYILTAALLLGSAFPEVHAKQCTAVGSRLIVHQIYFYQQPNFAEDRPKHRVQTDNKTLFPVSLTPGNGWG